jgi:WD40 repeat protein
MIVSGSYDKTLRVWDANSGSLIFGPLLGHTDPVASVAFSHDGKNIVSTSHDESLLWDIESGHLIPCLPVDHIPSFEPAAYALSLRASISDDGWVADTSGRAMLWIPTHFRTGRAVAVQASSIVLFDSQDFPIIVSGLGLSWWS